MSYLSAMPAYKFQFSDDEEDQEHFQTVSKETFPFGQYKGETYGDILRTKKGRDYFRYLLTWKELRPRTRARIDCCMEFYNNAKRMQ